MQSVASSRASYFACSALWINQFYWAQCGFHKAKNVTQYLAAKLNTGRKDFKYKIPDILNENSQEMQLRQVENKKRGHLHKCGQICYEQICL